MLTFLTPVYFRLFLVTIFASLLIFLIADLSIVYFNQTENLVERNLVLAYVKYLFYYLPELLTSLIGIGTSVTIAELIYSKEFRTLRDYCAICGGDIRKPVWILVSICILANLLLICSNQLAKAEFSKRATQIYEDSVMAYPSLKEQVLFSQNGYIHYANGNLTFISQIELFPEKSLLPRLVNVLNIVAGSGGLEPTYFLSYVCEVRATEIFCPKKATSMYSEAIKEVRATEYRQDAKMDIIDRTNLRIANRRNLTIREMLKLNSFSEKLGVSRPFSIIQMAGAPLLIVVTPFVVGLLFDRKNIRKFLQNLLKSRSA